MADGRRWLYAAVSLALGTGLTFLLLRGPKAPLPGAVPPAPPAHEEPPKPGMDPARIPALLARMNRGLNALERYDYAGAQEELRAAVEIAPGFYPAQFNLAVALVNNQKDPEAAERALRAAAALAPKEAAPHYMLGMLLTQGVSPPRAAEAEEEFRRAAALAPEDADVHHRIGLALRDAGKAEAAEAEFTRALEINPFLGAALYQRGLNRQQQGREKEAAEDLNRFREMERASRIDRREISYGFMGPLGNAIRDLEPWLPPEPPPEGDVAGFVEVKDVLDEAADPGGTLAVVDLDGDGLLDLVFSGAGGAGWRRNLAGWKFGPRTSFSARPAEGPAPDAAVADFDADGAPDVALGRNGIVLHAAAEPAWTKVNSEIAGRLLAADLDADGDIDLVAGRAVLLNDGKALLEPSPAPVDLPGGWSPAVLRDVDEDGFPDLVGGGRWVRNLRGGSFGGDRIFTGPEAEVVRDLEARRLLALGDVNADGIDDRLEAIGDGLVLLRGLPPGAPMPKGHARPGWGLPEGPSRGPARAAVLADLDGDRDLDLLVAQGGRLRFLANGGNAGAHTLHVRLAGVFHANGPQFGWSNPRGIGARVEAIAGRRRVVRWMGLDLALDGKPPPDVAVFGLAGAEKADLVSVRWPEGVIQAEPDVAVPPPRTGPVEIAEVQRKAASCPVVFSWDGTRFAFVADCMGGGGLGFLVAPGTYGPPDPTERVRIPGSLLRPRDGAYEVRLLEPLEEVTYADRLALVALDHPAGTEAYPDERFGGAPPAPGERVYVHRAAEQILPTRAVDARGADVTDRLARADRLYAEGFRLHRDLLGFTEGDHWIDLDFGDRIPDLREGERLVLFLDGWIEYGYSRSFYAAAGARMVPLSPVLEVPDGKGGWRTGIPDIGYPAGTPRVMTFDVTGIGGRAAPRFRIRTNLEIYWDRAWLAVDRGEGGLVRTVAAPAEARLRFAGFPREVSPDGRAPAVNDYSLMNTTVPGFKVMRGEFTRFGDVRSLVTEPDDRYVVFRNGEEIALRFRVSDFPPLREGMVRDFLLETTGWCKDMDYYTATPDTVEPLPFLGMSAFPPPAGEEYPGDEPHRAWRREYNTRVVR